MEKFGLIRELQLLANSQGWKFLLGPEAYANIDADFACGIGQLILWTDIKPVVLRGDGNGLTDINYTGSIVLMGKFDTDGINYAKLDETYKQKYDRRLEDLTKLLSDKIACLTCSNQLQINAETYDYVINIFDTNFDGAIGTFTINQDRFTSEQADYSLELISDSGSTIIPYEGINVFAKYTKVAIACIAHEGSIFEKWQIISDGVVLEKADNPLIITMNKNIIINSITI